MNRDQIIQQVIDDPQYLSFCKKICKGRDIAQDLYQYGILYLLEMDHQKVVDINNRAGIRNYLLPLFYRSINSNRSGFKYEYEDRNDFEEIDNNALSVADEVSEADPLDKFDEGLDRECNACIQKGIYPAAVKIYQLYEKMGSYKEVSCQTQIPYKTIRRYVHSTRETVIKKLNEGTDSNTK